MTATLARPIERRRFLGLSAGALAAAAAGCRPRDPGGARRSTLIIAVGDNERELVAVDGELLKNLVFLPLLTTNEDGELEGRLAERWEHSPSSREWTFHLRRDIRWHDGVPVTAQDVKFTLELLSHPDILEVPPHDVESSTVLDDATIRVRFGSWTASRSFTSGYEIILPEHLLAHLDPKRYSRWDFWKRPVGDGPYRFGHYVTKTMMRLDANPDYYRGKPRIEHVVLKFTQGAAIAELLSGNADILFGAVPGHSASGPSWRAYYGIYGRQLNGILWNGARPQLRESTVRRALTLAINRRELARVLNLPDSFPIVDGPFSIGQVRRGELPEPLPYDPEQARALFDAAGWRQRGGSGTRERDGQRFRFTLRVGNQPNSSQAAVYVQEALRRVGVGTEIETRDFGVLMPRMVRDGQFDALMTDVPAAPWLLKAWFGADSRLGYRNAEVSTLLERLPLVSDPAEEEEIYLQLTRIFRTEVPATFLFPRVTTVFASKRVRGLSSPWRVDPIRFIDELWLDDRGR
jgi:peptide/nickel transport system substrate-binding protein